MPKWWRHSMNIQPVTPRIPLCLGICCPSHGQCSRYLSLEGSSPEDVRIDSCQQGDERPLFVLRQVERVAA